jgi:putative protease
LCEAVRFAHEHGVKVYITVNIFADDDELERIKRFAAFLAEIGADAVIAADLGVVRAVAEAAPKLPIHISTQANITNAGAARVLRDMGAERIIAARELSVQNIEAMSRVIDVEIFAHGAMCVAYSGRCLLSAAMSGGGGFYARSANKGECTQPCRYEYALVESQRPNEYFPIEEDNYGTYILNSRDLCLISRIPDIIAAGVKSLKIEGRAKTPLYVAAVTKAYRNAIDDYYQSPGLYRENLPKYAEMLEMVSHREYCEGFLFDSPMKSVQITNKGYLRAYNFAGVVQGYDESTQTAVVEQRYKFCVGDTVEFLRHGAENFTQTVTSIVNEKGAEAESAPHPKEILRIKTDRAVREFDLIVVGNRDE